MATGGSPSLVLDDSGILVGEQRIDPFSPSASRQVRQLLGPEILTTVAGVKGSGRTAHWLQSGVVVVTEDAMSEALVMLFVCFDADDSSPYAERPPEIPVFRGSVRCREHVFSGGEPDAVVQRIPGLRGYGGMRMVNFGRLLVAFYLTRPRGPTGRRSGRRRLVKLSAEWGVVRGFTPKAGVSDPWAD
jgi:hypothetical protein